MELLNLLLIFLSGIVVGGIIIYLLMKFKTVSRDLYENINNLYIKSCSDLDNINSLLIKNEQEQTKQKNYIEKLLDEKKTLEIELSKNIIENNILKQKNIDQKEEVELLQDKFTKEFENLSNKILEEKSSKFTQQNKENISNVLSPLQEKILLFEKKIEESQKENISIHVSLKEQLKNLQDQNLKISQEAENLTKALKGDTKIQGNWGELILEKVLEKSGLRKDVEYFVQKNFDDPNNQGKRIIPDVVIHLSDNKKMIIDSKVSLTHYERFVNEENPIEKERHIKAHLNSIKRHVEELSAKKYHEIYNTESPDFVLLFIPNDPAFAYALNYEPSLWEKAFEKNIIIVTPITILATLKTIDSLWSIQKRQENAEEIARLAGSLYDKFIGFYENLKKIGDRLDQAKTEYSEAEKKLIIGNGNIVRTIEKLKKMGAKTSKSLPEELTKKLSESLESEESIKFLE